MERDGLSVESEPEPKDISEQFLNLDTSEFLALLRKLRNELALSINFDWRNDQTLEQNILTAQRLKAFLDSRGKQKRTATIQINIAEYDQVLNQIANEIASGVQLQKVAET